jgi:hypothetical protein
VSVAAVVAFCAVVVGGRVERINNPVGALGVGALILGWTAHVYRSGWTAAARAKRWGQPDYVPNRSGFHYWSEVIVGGLFGSVAIIGGVLGLLLR